MIQDTRCELCGNTTETLDHIMFKCKHSVKIWTTILHWMKMIDAKDIYLQWIKKYTPGKGWKQGLLKVVAAETLYGIWT